MGGRKGGRKGGREGRREGGREGGREGRREGGWEGWREEGGGGGGGGGGGINILRCITRNAHMHRDAYILCSRMQSFNHKIFGQAKILPWASCTSEQK